MEACSSSRKQVVVALDQGVPSIPTVATEVVRPEAEFEERRSGTRS